MLVQVAAFSSKLTAFPAAPDQLRPYSPFMERAGRAGSSFVQADVLKTLRIYGYASAFWPF